MGHISRRPAAVSMVAVSGFATLACAQADRFWVEPLIGTWDDAGNWSLTDAGPVGGGLPQIDDSVYFLNRAVCAFDGPGPGFPAFSSIELAGTGSGRTQLIQSNGLLNVGFVTIGRGNPRNDLKISAGLLESFEICVGSFAGGEGLFEISGSAAIGSATPVNRLLVGFSEASGLVDIQGGSLAFNEVYLSVDSNLGDPGGPADLTMTDGTLDIAEFYIGLGGQGFARFFGGTTTISDFCIVGLVAESGALRPQMNVAGGDVDINGPLTIGDFDPRVGEERGDGRVLVTSGSLTVTETRIADTTGTSGELIIAGGIFETDSIEVGLGGFGSVRLDAGSLDVTNDAIIGAGGVLSAGDLEINNGSFTVGSLRIAAESSAQGSVVMADGSVDATTIRIGDSLGSGGAFEISGGQVVADTVAVGGQGRGNLTLTGGTIDAGSLVISENTGTTASGISQLGGTLFADTIAIRPNATPILTAPFEYSMQGGILVSQSVTIEPEAHASWVQQADARVATITNNGRFTFGGGEAKLSGPLLGPPFNTRLIGDFINNGVLNASTQSVGTLFAMDLFNNGTIDLFDDEFRVSGSIVNDGTIELTSFFYDGFGAIALSSLSLQGIVNNADLITRFVRIDAPNGAVVNNGTMTGFAQILAPFTNNGALLPDPDRVDENLLEIDGGFTAGPASSARFVITNTGHNRIDVTGGDIDLDGTVNVAFAQGVPLPPRGTEYDLVTCPDGLIGGSFASEAILGYPCEIIYGRNRVFARTLRCSVADFAPPFGVLDLTDITSFVGAFSSGNPLADINGDSFLDLADITAFVTAFTDGCP